MNARGKKGPAADGLVQDDGVHVPDVAQANRLQNKAQAGTPQADNTLHLSAIEAAYAVSAGWLEVTHAGQVLGPMDIVARSANPERVLTDYLVYRDLRTRGFVVRHDGHRFTVWPRGTSKGPALFETLAFNALHPVDAALVRTAASDGVVASVVDDDSRVTHYRLAIEVPQGSLPNEAPIAAQGRVVSDRVIVTDGKACHDYAKQFRGTPEGNGRLLSALEAHELWTAQQLRIDGTLPPVRPELIRTCAALRTAGVLPQSGLRFGCDLRGYMGPPDDAHAAWLIQCVPATARVAWSDLARGVRLAHGVRKKFLLALVGPDDVQFTCLSWQRV